MCFEIYETFSMFYYYSSIFLKNSDLAGFQRFILGFLGVFECSSDGKSSEPVGNTDELAQPAATVLCQPTSEQAYRTLTFRDSMSHAALSYVIVAPQYKNLQQGQLGIFRGPNSQCACHKIPGSTSTPHQAVLHSNSAVIISYVLL